MWDRVVRRGRFCEVNVHFLKLKERSIWTLFDEGLYLYKSYGRVHRKRYLQLARTKICLYKIHRLLKIHYTGWTCKRYCLHAIRMCQNIGLIKCIRVSVHFVCTGKSRRNVPRFGINNSVTTKWKMSCRMRLANLKAIHHALPSCPCSRSIRERGPFLKTGIKLVSS